MLRTPRTNCSHHLVGRPRRTVPNYYAPGVVWGAVSPRHRPGPRVIAPDGTRGSQQMIMC